MAVYGYAMVAIGVHENHPHLFVLSLLATGLASLRLRLIAAILLTTYCLNMLALSGLGRFYGSRHMALEPLLGVSVLGGLFGAGLNLALFSILLQVCPDERRPSYVAIYNTLVNVAAFCAPLFGTFLSNRLGIRMALVSSGVVRLAGVAAFYWLAPRDVTVQASDG